YFHRTNYRSDVINTDRLGFRISHGASEPASAGGNMPKGPVRLFVGSSTAMGIGAESDAATLPSRLWSKYAPSRPWLNFAGRSYSSVQELMLFMLHRHLLPEIDEIVLFSGLNNLATARLPKSQRGEHGAFFNCGDFFDQMDALKLRVRKAKLGLTRRAKSTPPPADEPVRPLDVRMSDAVELTVRHLDSWQIFAQAAGARVSFVLQPLATWVREEPAAQEKLLFGELDKISNFWQLFGDIATKESGRRYADELRQACEKQGVPFLDINPVLADAVTEQNWLFVDRAHFTDEGHDIVARLLAEQLNLS
ncbi:MAG: SGNH/GDSL hydrolase family protein, partial [Micromonosporaceae bacterium]